MEVVLVTGALGQLGSELTEELSNKFGNNNVITTDIRRPADPAKFIFEELDILNRESLYNLIKKYKITQIYHLAAVLSAKGEQNPQFAWQLNMDGLLNVLEAARELKIKKVFWPSSIGAFGKNTPKTHTPQHTIMEPETIYGISKLAGERWCAWYHEHYGVDVRSLRYPGIISYKTLPGGGTTDYAVDIYFKAVEGKDFVCFLEKDTYLPMIYMPDAIRATIELMEADSSEINVRSSYNLAAISFTPEQIATVIKQHFPPFNISYKPDFRQKIADSWPDSIDDSSARNDWGWKPFYNLQSMTADMVVQLQKKMEPNLK